MKKVILSILVLLSTLAYGSEIYVAQMNGLLNDSKKIQTALTNKSLVSISTDEELKNSLSAYKLKSAAFTNSLVGSLTDPAVATQMLDKTDALSISTLSLSQSILNLSDKTLTNTDSTYLKSLESLTQTTLRLSDDIGKMADRIGDMADRIGEMADRIVDTQELISKNSKMINDSMLIVMDKFDFEQTSKIEQSLGQIPLTAPNIPMPVAPPSMPGSF